MNKVNWERKHDGRASFARNVEEGGEIAKLHRLWHRGQNASGLNQLLRCLLLTFCVDDLRSASAFGLRLPGDRADHALVEIDLLDLDIRDLDAPGLGLLVEHLLNVGIELVLSASIWSRSCLPKTQRSVVCASWLVATR